MVGRGFLDSYLTFREESTKDNFQIADKSKIECNNCPVPHKFFRNWAVPDPTSLLIH